MVETLSSDGVAAQTTDCSHIASLPDITPSPRVEERERESHEQMREKRERERELIFLQHHPSRHTATSPHFSRRSKEETEKIGETLDTGHQRRLSGQSGCSRGVQSHVGRNHNLLVLCLRLGVHHHRVDGVSLDVGGTEGTNVGHAVKLDLVGRRWTLQVYL